MKPSLKWLTDVQHVWQRNTYPPPPPEQWSWPDWTYRFSDYRPPEVWMTCNSDDDKPWHNAHVDPTRTTKNFSGIAECFSTTKSLTSNYLNAPMAKLEVAAGARIKQQVYEDTSDLSFWRSEPEGVIYAHYVTEEAAQAILDAGKRDYTAGGEGFLAGLRVGNP